MKVKRTTACAAIVLLVVLCSYSLRSFVWGYSSFGEPDVSGMLASPSGDIIIADEDIPLADLPGESGEALSAAIQDQLADLMNAERKNVGLAVVEESRELSLAAETRAQEIKDSFSHTRPDGSNYKTVLTENGIAYSFSGENIAGGYPSPEDVLSAWMDNDGFRDNILNPDFTRVGVGYYDDIEQGMRYWCVLFVF